LSPKILLVAPEKRLSWQYHHRRAEIWKVVSGQVGVVRSETDQEGDLVVHTTGEVIKLAQGERHRLVGLAEQGVIAEIWQHTDANHPSDEDDIVRVQDDFGR
jgi:mannose-6-phosphate isomerase-like protein (cupin superfamily)